MKGRRSLSARILVVEDDPSILELVTFHLEKEGYEVFQATDGRSGIERFAEVRPHLVLVDLMLPEIDGFDLCRRIRKASSTPIIILTAKGQEADRIQGFELGADDYVTKPFSPRELVARVRAVLRRSRAEDEATLSAGELVLDRKRRRVFVSGREVELTPKEFDLLALLMSHRGEPIDRETLLEQVWGYGFPGGSRTVDVHVRRLRQKIGDDPYDPKFIETVHGVGYRFKEETPESLPPRGAADAT